MQILIADDDPVCRRLLESTLHKWNYDVTAVGNGASAWQVLNQPQCPRLAILDWLMPELNGVEICRKLRDWPVGQHKPYVLLLSGRTEEACLVEGLEAGADDYITKPFSSDELRARLRVGERLIELQQALVKRVANLEEALARVKQLQGMLPICAWCKKIRDDQHYWQRVEDYICTHSDARVTHGICPDCLRNQVESAKPRLPRSPGQGAASSDSSSV